jgi:hypothetical protein
MEQMTRPWVARDGAHRGHQRERFQRLVRRVRHVGSEAHQVVEQPDRVESLLIREAGLLQNRVRAALLVKQHSKFHVRREGTTWPRPTTNTPVPSEGAV